MNKEKAGPGFDSMSTEAPAGEGNETPRVTAVPAAQLDVPIVCPVTSLKPGTSNVSKRWFRHLLTEADAKIMEHSGKMVLLFKILKLAEELEEKVYVVFPHRI